MIGPALLFCPGDRPERFVKAAERSDTVILDLEDAVGVEAKQRAREAVAASRLDPGRTIVRVNASGSGFLAADLEALAASDYRTVMVPKAEDPAALDGLADYEIIALCETARGVLNAPSLAAHPQVTGLMWGAEDLVASLGGTASRRPDGSYRDVARQARARVLLAAGAYDVAAIDAVYLAIEDEAGQRLEAEDAAASGFTATACIHPSQVGVIREAYRPSDTELNSARRLVKAARSHAGVFRFEGRMIDGPLLRNAETVLARGAAGRPGAQNGLG